MLKWAKRHTTLLLVLFTSIVAPLFVNIVSPQLARMFTTVSEWTPKGPDVYNSSPTFGELMDLITSEPPVRQDQRAHEFLGMKVKWKLDLLSGHPVEGGKVRLAFHQNLSMSSGVVWVDIDPSQYPQLQTAREETSVWVAGAVSSCSSIGVDLADAQIHVAPSSWRLVKKYPSILLFSAYALVIALGIVGYRVSEWRRERSHRPIVPESEIAATPPPIKETSSPPPFDEALFKLRPLPSEIVKQIELEPPVSQEAYSRKYVGLRVQWLTSLGHAARDRDKARITLEYADEIFPLIDMIIELEQYPELSVTSKGASIWVAGTISRCSNTQIFLSNVQLRVIP